MYITVTSGLPVTVHYCMDKMIGWEVSHQAPGKCGKCGMEKKGHQGCCHDEQQFLKVDKAHQSSDASFSFLNISADLPKAYNTSVSYFNSPSIIKSNPSHAPPREQVATYIFICVFRI